MTRELDQDVYLDVRSLSNRLTEEIHDRLDEDCYQSVTFYSKLRDKLDEVLHLINVEGDS